ncbi:hypothetical protein [Streptomyces sp. 7N604]|uniref:hypothetical protein n=1 Tax=Streptomyces sp. 7N604 TaxID=3457415 RepID=UPI003FD5E8CC
MGRLPSRHFALNQAWLELALSAADLIADTTQTLLLKGELATVEPKSSATGYCTPPASLAAGRRLRLRIAATWPWRHELGSAFVRLMALSRPAT